MDNDERLDMDQAEGVVTPQDADENAGDQVREDQGGQSSDAAEQSASPAQSHEDNRRYQAARRQGDRSGYERGTREYNARIAKLGMRNPADGSLITDLDGLEAYSKAARHERIRQRAADEGRPEAEIEEEEANREFITSQRKAAEDSGRKRSAEQKQREWIQEDAENFMDRFPDVDLAALDNNRAFLRFCGTRYGREPLADLYQDWLELAGDAERTAQEKSRGKQARETGAGSRSGAAESLTAAQQRELDEWNRAYPGLKMTAKEFLTR